MQDNPTVDSHLRRGGIPLRQKKYALMAAAASRARGLETKLIEDTTLRFRSPAAIDFHDEKFQIDISNQIP